MEEVATLIIKIRKAGYTANPDFIDSKVTQPDTQSQENEGIKAVPIVPERTNISGQSSTPAAMIVETEIAILVNDPKSLVGKLIMVDGKEVGEIFESSKTKSGNIFIRSHIYAWYIDYVAELLSKEKKPKSDGYSIEMDIRKIIVNTREVEIGNKEIMSYDEIKEIAYPDVVPTIIFTITYSRGHMPEQGMLSPGKSVEVIHGMHFTVVHTGDA
jgi:hypothetical protein